MIYHHPRTKKHLGMAYIVFQEVSDAGAFIEKYNGVTVMGSAISCSFDPYGNYIFYLLFCTSGMFQFYWHYIFVFPLVFFEIIFFLASEVSEKYQELTVEDAPTPNYLKNINKERLKKIRLNFVSCCSHSENHSENCESSFAKEQGEFQIYLFS